MDPLRGSGFLMGRSGGSGSRKKVKGGTQETSVIKWKNRVGRKENSESRPRYWQRHLRKRDPHLVHKGDKARKKPYDDLLKGILYLSVEALLVII